MNMYEQIKDDLGYLQLGHATEVFATLAEEARDDDMTYIEFLSRPHSRASISDKEPAAHSPSEVCTVPVP